MQKHESKNQVIFNHWLKNVFKQTGVFELKQTQTDSIPFSAVVPHQIEALLAVREGRFVWKIPDAGFQNPFDCFSMVNEQAYVVIFYPKAFILIPILVFIQEKQRSKRKSLTYERALEISPTLTFLRK